MNKFARVFVLCCVRRIIFLVHPSHRIFSEYHKVDSFVVAEENRESSSQTKLNRWTRLLRRENLSLSHSLVTQGKLSSSQRKEINCVTSLRLAEQWKRLRK